MEQVPLQTKQPKSRQADSQASDKQGQPKLVGEAGAQSHKELTPGAYGKPKGSTSHGHPDF